MYKSRVRNILLILSVITSMIVTLGGTKATCDRLDLSLNLLSYQQRINITIEELVYQHGKCAERVSCVSVSWNALDAKVIQIMFFTTITRFSDTFRHWLWTGPAGKHHNLLLRACCHTQICYFFRCYFCRGRFARSPTVDIAMLCDYADAALYCGALRYNISSCDFMPRCAWIWRRRSELFVAVQYERPISSNLQAHETIFDSSLPHSYSSFPPTCYFSTPGDARRLSVKSGFGKNQWDRIVFTECKLATVVWGNKYVGHMNIKCKAMH